MYRGDCSNYLDESPDKRVLICKDYSMNILIDVMYGSKYFRLQDHIDHEKSKKICRISIYESKYIIPGDDTKEEWILSNTEKARLLYILNQSYNDITQDTWWNIILNGLKVSITEMPNYNYL